MQVQVNHLTHSFTARPPRPAIQDLSFQINSGQFVAVIGPSGCGKSTLLRIIANLIQPTKGEIHLDGKPASEANTQRRLAWMAQSPALLPWLTARQNVALAQRFLPRNTNHRLTPEEALLRVGLQDAADTYPFALSGGMQQRVALARLLSLNAGLWLMDEPFAALDELTREHMAAQLLDLWQPLKPTVLWITHNIHEALRLADRILVLSTRPAQLVADLRVDLPRPRHEFEPDFQAALARLRNDLSLSQGFPEKRKTE